MDNVTNCRWCLSNGLAGGDPAPRNRSHFLMLKTANASPSAMVIPFRHAETPFEFTAEEWSDLGNMLTEAKRHLAEFQPDGFTIGWNVGAAGGQHVFHAHMHVICRFKNETAAGLGLKDFLRPTE